MSLSRRFDVQRRVIPAAMTAPYTLHYAPDNASLIIRIALDMIRVPYRTQLVDRAVRAQDSAPYRKVNPLGMIPALETPNGPIFETGAILLWLADTHGGLLPAADHPLRGDALKWLFFTSNSLHAGLRQMFYPEKFVADGTEAQLREGIARRVRADFEQMDQVVAQSPLFTDNLAPALDIYLCALLRWATIYPSDYNQGWARTETFSNLHDRAKTLEEHSAAIYTAQAEGLGDHPFTKPAHPNPPEGSAT